MTNYLIMEKKVAENQSVLGKYISPKNIYLTQHAIKHPTSWITVMVPVGWNEEQIARHNLRELSGIWVFR